MASFLYWIFYPKMGMCLFPLHRSLCHIIDFKSFIHMSPAHFFGKVSHSFKHLNSIPIVSCHDVFNYSTFEWHLNKYVSKFILLQIVTGPHRSWLVSATNMHRLRFLKMAIGISPIPHVLTMWLLWADLLLPPGGQ